MFVIFGEYWDSTRSSRQPGKLRERRCTAEMYAEISLANECVQEKRCRRLHTCISKRAGDLKAVLELFERNATEDDGRPSNLFSLRQRRRKRYTFERQVPRSKKV